MVTQIIDDTSCIRILFDDRVSIINKSWVRTVETVQADTVKIDIAAGPLKHVYVKFSEVSQPAGLADVNALRDAIKDMLDTFPGNQGNAATAKVAVLLEKLLASGGVNTNTAAITDETVPNVVYYGYASKGGVTSQPTWAINRVSLINGITTSVWANGTNAYDNVWDNRYALKYLPLDNSADGQS